MNYTEKYHFPQWVKTDRIMMDDFNAAMSSLENGIAEAKDTADTARTEAAEAAVKPYVTGTYRGTFHSQYISLGFQPAAVLIGKYPTDGTAAACSLTIGYNGNVMVNSDGFEVMGLYGYPDVNSSDQTYYYVAFR